MAVMELWRRRDLEGTVKPEYIDGNFFTQDSVGNLVGVKCYKDGAEVALTGSVTGYCVLPSGETVSVAGTRSGNQASILVPQSALAYTGPLGIALKLIDGNTITTLMSIIVVVYRSKTDTVITPSSQIITDWANQISAALQEVEDASAAQDAKIADLKSALYAEDPMTPLLFNLYYFRKGSVNSGTEQLVRYSAVRKINDQFADLNAASGSGSSGYIALRLNDENLIPFIASGETVTIFLYVKSNKALSFKPKLSTNTIWAPNNSVAVCNDINISVGCSIIPMVFRFDHSGSDGRTAYRYIVFEGNNNYSDLDLAMSFVRGENFSELLDNLINAVNGISEISHYTVKETNPMNPLLFRKMYWSKGNYTSEQSTDYGSNKFVNDQFSAFNAASGGSGFGYFSFLLNAEQYIPFVTAGNTLAMWAIVKSNKALTGVVFRLSTNTTWGPQHSVSVAESCTINSGYNLILLNFSTDHAGTDGRDSYHYLCMECQNNFSDLDLQISFVRGDNFLGYIETLNDRIAVLEQEGEHAYDTDLLFWGDSLTAGAGGNGTSYPAVCASQLGKTYKNCGVGGETANTISARQGGNTVIIPAGTINGQYAYDAFKDIFGGDVRPLRQGNGSQSGSKVIIDDMECTLTISQSSSTSTDAIYTIAGYAGGTSALPKLARFAGSDFTGGVVIIWVGQNGAKVGNDTSISARMAIIDSMIAHIQHKRYVVLGLSSGTESGRAAEDSAMLAKYGNKFFPTRKMLVEQGMTIAGLTPTTQDQTDIAAGTVPTSLRSDGVHLNASGYTALGKMIAAKIVSLGYFS